MGVERLKRWLAGVLAACTLLGSGAVLSCGKMGSWLSLDVQAATESSMMQVPLSSLLASVLPDGTAVPVTEAEAHWLDYDQKDAALAALRESLSVRHRTSMPLSLLSTELHDEGGMTLTLRPYTDGEQNWIPSAVLVDGQLYVPTLDNGFYTVELSDAMPEDDTVLTVAVDYQTEFALDGESLAVLAGAAHRAVTDALALRSDYETRLVAYQAAVAAYDRYLTAWNQYKVDLQRYNQYVKAKQRYDADLEAYQTYLANMETYRAEKAVYDAYMVVYREWQAEYDAYMAILNNPEEYNKKYQAYVEWQNNMALVEYQLAVVESCFVTDSQSHRLYSTLRGETVATVVENKDLFVSSGCNEQDINNADAATAALIDWLNGHEPLKTPEAMYDYYAQHYAALRDNVKKLYTALARLYTNKIVPEQLAIRHKLERYHQFVAQLYVLWCALDDTAARDMNWTIANKKAEDLLEDCFLLPDNNRAMPLSGYPAPMEEVLPPSQLKQPERPTEVACPREPVEVTEPMEPAEVTKPVLPAAVPKPGAAPQAPAFNAYLLALMDSQAAGVTDGRTLDASDRRYTATVRQEWAVRTTEDRVMNFYSADGSVLLQSVTVPDGEEVVLPDENVLQAAAPADTRQYTYVGIGWADENGEWVGGCGERLTATEDGRFHAVYEARLREYTVTWVVGDDRTQITVPYGTLPVYDGADASRLGWTPAVTEVTGDVEYHGTYRTESHYTVTWKWGEGEEDCLDMDYATGQIPVFPGEIPFEEDGRYVYTFLEWSPAVTPVDRDTVYEAVCDVLDRTPGLPADATVSVERDGTGWRISGQGWMTDGSFCLGLSTLLEQSGAERVAVTLEADGMTVVLRKEAVTALSGLADVELMFSRVADGFSFGVTAVSGTSRVPVEGVLADVGFAYPADQWVEMIPSDGAGSSGLQMPDQNGEVWFSVTAGEAYRLNDGYAIRVDAVNGGQVTFDSYVAKAGETVTVTSLSLPGYRLAGLTVTVGDAEVPVIPTEDGKGATFVMPEGDVTVRARFQLIEYTISFYSEGVLVMRNEHCLYGSTVEPPEDPVSVDGRPFVGWSPAITPVTGDARYEAVFLTVGEEDSDDRDVLAQEHGMTVAELAVVAVVTWLLVSGGVLTAFFLWRRQRMKRADAKRDDLSQI